MRQYSKKFFWSFLALFFGFLAPFGIFYFLGGISFDSNFNQALLVAEEKIPVSPVFITSSRTEFDYAKEEEELPVEVGYFFRNKYDFPSIGAEAFLIADLDSGQIIKTENQTLPLPIASVTKLMTALVSLETINQYERTTISKNAISTYGLAGGLYEGQEILVKELIYPLLLESSNDAAVALAEHIGFGDFVSAMNEKAKSVGLLSTYYEEPSGLSANNVSTAEDLFRLARYIHSSKRYILNITQKQNYDYWFNNNSFLTNKYFLGGKNGYTPEAKRTAVALLSLPLSEFKNKRMAVVLLRTDTRERDMARVVNWLKSEVYYGEKPAEEKRPEITSLVFTGDIMMDRGVENSVLLNADGDFSYLFKNVDFIKEADIAFGNLEGPVSGKGQDLGSANSFRFEPESLDALVGAGFDVLSVANNHAGDWSSEAFEDSLKRLSEEGVLAIGGGENGEEAISVKVVEKNGLKIGFLGFSDVGPDWFKAGESKPGVSVVGDDFGFLVGQAANQVDVLVVSMHFGEEYEKISNDRQKYLARLAVDNGAKIVIGHHSHVVQEVESYKGAVIAYSLGNFVFDQNFSEETTRGLVLRIFLSGYDIAAVERKTIKINKSFRPELAE